LNDNQQLWRTDRCDGGTEIEVFEFAQSTGIKFEYEIKYNGKIDRCRVKGGDGVARIKDFRAVIPNNPP